jgi:glycosyltransferase involved in cell wall biosynthesis
MTGWGSWEWLGADLSAALEGRFDIARFDAWSIPPADAVVFVKHPPPRAVVEHLTGTAIVFCPVDAYGAVREIAADAWLFRRCDRVVLHSARLREFFAPYCEPAYLDHHLKFVGQSEDFRPDGPVLWTGVRSNLPAVVEWVNEHGPPGELWVLTNPEQLGQIDPETFGFKSDVVARLEEWTPERHREWASLAGAAFDVKGEDFRSRHKPPTKALDFVASGLPLAMNADASAVEHLAGLGLAVPSPHDRDRWRSREYWEETQRLGARLRKELTLKSVADRLATIIDEVLDERDGDERPNSPAKRRRAAIDLAAFGRDAEAEVILGDVVSEVSGGADEDRGRAQNDLGVLAALQGRLAEAREHFAAAAAFEPSSALAAENLAVLDEPPERETEPIAAAAGSPAPVRRPDRPRVALASFLFNWPSTGGGIVHTVELGKFLQAAGYDVHHFYARRLDLGIGRADDPLPYDATPIDFSGRDWSAEAIRGKFHAAVGRYGPTRAIITDSWNTKPLLADALAEWPFLLRFQALECLCPLNNIRLLPDEVRGVRQCSLHQLATPDDCRTCVGRLGNHAGSLHQIERAVAGYGSAEYDRTLRRVLKKAHAVLVVNPLMEAMLAPYASRIVVCPAGMDPERFPLPAEPPAAPNGIKRILFAGLVHEFIKGYHVLRQAAALLWQRRQDFRVVVTSDPVPDAAPFEEFIGWQSQGALPKAMAASDVVAVPAVAQEAIGRTAVEGMAAGRSVVASRIGGLPFALGEGAAGLLAEPSDPADLTAKLSQLLDDGDLRARLGRAGRRRFEERFTWPGVIERQYRPLIEDGYGRE